MSTDEMEKYRNKDREEEAGTCMMGEMRKDREGGLPNDVNGLIDHYRQEVRKGQEAHDKLLKELNMLRGTKLIVESLSKDLSQMRKRAQEAEGELSILRGIETNRVKEAQAALANALEVNESHQKLNGKLQERLTEVEQENIELHAENKKIHNHLQERVEGARRAGM
jgi:DNA repair exonuclease SbcCD ATPase subunit